MHPCTLSDVTHSAFGPQRLRDVNELIYPVYVFGIPKRVKPLVQLEFEHKGLIGTCGEFSVPFSLTKGTLRRFQASREGVGFGPPTPVHACVSRVDFACV